MSSAETRSLGMLGPALAALCGFAFCATPGGLPLLAILLPALAVARPANFRTISSTHGLSLLFVVATLRELDAPLARGVDGVQERGSHAGLL